MLGGSNVGMASGVGAAAGASGWLARRTESTTRGAALADGPFETRPNDGWNHAPTTNAMATAMPQTRGADGVRPITRFAASQLLQESAPKEPRHSTLLGYICRRSD